MSFVEDIAVLLTELGRIARLAGLVTGRSDPAGLCFNSGKKVDWVWRGFSTITASEVWVEVAVTATEVCGASGPSRMRRAAERPGEFIAKKEGEKYAKYVDELPPHALLYTAVWETAGRMGRGLLQLLALLEAEAAANRGITRTQFRRLVRHRLSTVLVIGNTADYLTTRAEIMKQAQGAQRRPTNADTAGEAYGGAAEAESNEREYAHLPAEHGVNARSLAAAYPDVSELREHDPDAAFIATSPATAVWQPFSPHSFHHTPESE